MPYDVILMAHHVSAIALFAIVIAGIIAPRLSAKTQATLFPVEGMGGMAAILFQVVSGANLTGRSEISWGEPWISATLALFGLAAVSWLASLALRSKNKSRTVSTLLGVIALGGLVVSYGVMLVKPVLW